MQRRNWKGKMFVLIMAFMMVFAFTNTSMSAFAADGSSGNEDSDRYYDISKMNPQIEMEYNIDGTWRDQAWVESKGTTIAPGTEIRFKIRFNTPDKNHDYKAEDQLHYEYMSSLLNISQLSGAMKDGSETAGSWKVVTESGKGYRLLIDLDDEYIGLTPNLDKGYVTLKGQINYTPGDTDTITIPFPGADPIVVPVQTKTVTPASLKVTKGKLDKNGNGTQSTDSNIGIYKEDGKYWAKYYVTVENTGDETAEGVTVEDYPGMWDSTPNNGSYNPVAKGDPIFAKQDGREIIEKISATDSTAQFTYKNGKWVWSVGSIAAHESVTFKYRIQLTDEAAEKNVAICNDAAAFMNGKFMHSDYEDSSVKSGLNNPEKTAGTYHLRADGKGVISYEVNVSAKASNFSTVSNVKVRDYFTNSSYSDLLDYDSMKVTVGGVKWNGSITEGKDSSGRKYCEFTVASLQPGQNICFTYDVIVDDAMFDANTATGENNKEVALSASKKIENTVEAYLGSTKSGSATASSTVNKGWLKKNGTKKGDGFWEFTLKINEPKAGEPCLVTSSSVNNIADRLGTGWVYCGSDKDTNGSIIVKKYPISADGQSYDREHPITVNVPLSEVLVNRALTNEESKNGKYASMWKWEDTGAYYYEVTYYAKRVDDNVSDSMGNSAGYGIGPGLKPFDHEVEWMGTDSENVSIKKAATGFNDDYTAASWKISVTHDVKGGWTVSDKPIADSSYKNHSIKKGSLQIGILDGDTITPLPADSYTDYTAEGVTNDTGVENCIVKFNKAVAASKEKPIVITYETELNQNDISNASNGTKLSYKNEATLQGSASNKASATSEQSFTKPSNITKKGSVSNGVITWEINVNATGHMSGDAVVTDVIPEGLEYVEGSAKVSSRGSSAKATQVDFADVKDGKLVMSFTGLQRTENDKAYVKIQLKTKIVDPSIVIENVSNKSFTNSAELDYNNKKTTANAKVTVSNTVLSKSSSNKEHEIAFTIEINKNSMDMNPDGDTVKLIDEYSSNMMVETNTILVEKYNSSSKKWETLDPQPTASVADGKLTMNVPDNIRMRLTYTCYVFGETGDKVSVDNKVSFEGSKTVVTKKPSIDIKDGEGGIDGFPNVKIKKYDGSDSTKTIEGVQFQLYEVSAGSDGKLAYAEAGAPKTTNDSGMLVFSQLSADKVYAFQEVQAKPEFVSDSTKIYFYFDKKAVTADIQQACTDEGIELKKVNKGFVFERANTPTDIGILKVDTDDTSKVLEGAELAILDEDGEVIDSWESGKTPHHVKKLIKGKKYFLKEMIPPDGYGVTGKTEFVIGDDGQLDEEQTTEGTIREDDGVLTLLNRDPKADATINVTKNVVNSAYDKLAATGKYYVALFSDEQLTDRVSKVKTLSFNGTSSETVSFDVLKGTKYYVAETDADGKALSGRQFTGESPFLICFGDPEELTETWPEQAEVVVPEESEEAEDVEFSNVYFGPPPQGFYKQGSVTVTKKVLDYDGKDKNVDESFYVTLFQEKNGEWVKCKTVEIKLDESSEATKLIDDELALGKYRIEETDAEGTVVGDSFGYDVSFHNVTSDSDSNEFEIVNTDDETVPVDFEFTLTNKVPDTSLTIEKGLKHNSGDEDADDFTAQEASFYVALYSDPELTERVTEPKELSYSGSSVESVTFDTLPIGVTYYIGETDAEGNLLKPVERMEIDGTKYLVEMSANVEGAENDITTVDGSNTFSFDNIIYDIPEKYYKEFSLTKKVTDSNGKARKYSGTFYVTIFSGEEKTEDQIVKIIPIKLSNQTQATVVIDQKELEAYDEGKFWLAETDANGKPVDSKFEFTPNFSQDTFEISAGDEFVDNEITLTNKGKPGTFGPETGDQTNLPLPLILMAMALAAAVTTLFAGRRRRQNG